MHPIPVMPPAPTETAKAAAAYAAYEGLGPERSLEKLVKLWGKSRAYVGQLERWSAQFHWVARAQAFDLAALERERTIKAKVEETRLKRKEERDARRTEARMVMDDERAPIMQAEWKRMLRMINERVDAGEYKGIIGLVALFKQTLDEERLARGGATAIHEQRVGGPDGAPVQVQITQEFGTASILATTEAIHAANALLIAIAGRGDVPSGSRVDGE